MAKKKQLKEDYGDIPEKYHVVINDFIEWLALCSYDTEQITEICTSLVEFIKYLTEKKVKLENISEEFMHSFYLDALKKEELPNIPPQYKPSMALIICRQNALHAFSRFIIGTGKNLQSKKVANKIL